MVRPEHRPRHRISDAEVAAIRLLLTLSYPLLDGMMPEAANEALIACAAVQEMLSRIGLRGRH